MNREQFRVQDENHYLGEAKMNLLNYTPNQQALSIGRTSCRISDGSLYPGPGISENAQYVRFRVAFLDDLSKSAVSHSRTGDFK